MLKEKLLPFVDYTNSVALEGLNPGEIGFLRLVLQRMKGNLLRKIEETSGSPKMGTEVDL